MSRKASPEAHVQKTVIEGTVLDALYKSVDAYVTVAPKTSLLRGDEREAPSRPAAIALPLVK